VAADYCIRSLLRHVAIDGHRRGYAVELWRGPMADLQHIESCRKRIAR